MVLEGPHTFFPIGYLSKMMSTVAYSTPEGETGALSYGLRSAGSPGMVMWEMVSDQVMDVNHPKGELPQTLIVHGDSSASISIAKSGKNPTMRHMGRTHGVSLTWISNELKSRRADLGYIRTKHMAADIFTKFYPKEKREVWKSMKHLINVYGPDEECAMFGTAGIGYLTALERQRAKQHDFSNQTAAVDFDTAECHKYLSDFNAFALQAGVDAEENHGFNPPKYTVLEHGPAAAVDEMYVLQISETKSMIKLAESAIRTKLPTEFVAMNVYS